MKLTNYMRDAFVRQVMADVPKIDYDEKIRAATVKAALDLSPAFVRKAWANTDDRRWLETNTVFVGNHRSVSVPMVSDYDGREQMKAQIRDTPAVAALCAAEKAQAEACSALEGKVHGVAYGMTTRKTLADALPEFAKYLPADEPAAIRSLPVIANVVSDFVKAGWPKDAKKASAKAAA